MKKSIYSVSLFNPKLYSMKTKTNELFRQKFGIRCAIQVVLLATVISISANCFSQTYSWANRIGGTNADAGYDIATDASGNVYVVGEYQGTADFDPGAGTVNLTSAGNIDLFFSKYSSTGTYLWAKSLGSTNADYCRSVVVDGSGNIYITGAFSGTIDFDPGAGTNSLTSSGQGDIYFAKYDASGNHVWAYKIGNSGNEFGWNIGIDGSSNVYLSGVFQGTTDFDPGAGTASLTSNGSPNDIFFAKYSSTGGYLWANRIGGTTADYARDMAVDAAGNVYITGEFQGTVDFDPGAGTANLIPAGFFEVYFAKYSTAGAYVWAKNIGGANGDIGYGIAVDGTGSIYITGYFETTADFDPGAGTANLTVGGSNDIFVAKYTSAGNYVWANKIGGIGSDLGYNIAFDASSNVYITGSFASTADFDPGAGTANLTSTGPSDVFIAKYSSTGGYIFAFKIGGGNTDVGRALAVNASSGMFHVTGEFQNTADFDPSASTASLVSAGNTDIFFAKYSSAATAINEIENLTHTFIVYPNPSQGEFSIRVAKGQLISLSEKNLTIEIYNEVGARVFSSILNKESFASGNSSGNTETITLDISAGMYLYTISDGEKTVGTGKLLVE